MKFLSNEAVYNLIIHKNTPNLPFLLFFHGFMGTGKVFEQLTNRLIKECNPVTIDLLGHGQSFVKADPERFSVENQLKDLHSILDRLMLHNLFLYGYSMGGRLAQHLFLSDPSRFSGLILESTTCGITDQKERKIRAEADQKRSTEIETDFQAFIDRWIELPLLKTPKGSNDFNYESILRNQNPELMAASLRGFGTGVIPPVCNQLKQIKKPVGLLAGKADQKYVDKMGEMAQLCSKSEIEIIKGAGHRVHVDQPDQTAKFITQFLNTYGRMDNS